MKEMLNKESRRLDVPNTVSSTH